MNSISLLSAVLLLSVSLVTAGCTGDRTPAGGTHAEVADIPFTEEGTLTFKRADGEQITTIRLEIADDDSTRTRGLMQRTSMPADAGMLFVFPDESIRSFWMANTPLSLDIMFATRAGEIVDIAKYTKPFSPENVTSRAPATYVIEVKAGFADTWGISETDRVEWSAHK